MYTEDQMTGWINGEPPVREGVYQVKTAVGHCYAYWSPGGGWGSSRNSPQAAIYCRDNGRVIDFFHSSGSWRGLNHNPKTK